MTQNKNEFLDEYGLQSVINRFVKLFAKITHTHKLSEISDYTVDSSLSSASTNPIQNKAVNFALNGKANSSHGTHVSYSSTAPVMDGTASVGSASTVARSDHKHPTDTSRASQLSLDSHTSNKSNPHGVTKSQVGLGNVPNVATNDQTPTFSQASSRTNIVSGENFSVILGKIMKYFADLKTVAFSGSYNDLSNKPTIPSAYTHPTSSGNKHIPSGGSSGQILKWYANGTAVWGNNDSLICNVVETLPSTGVNGALYVVKK